MKAPGLAQRKNSPQSNCLSSPSLYSHSFFTGRSLHARDDKIRAKFGDIRCRKSWPEIGIFGREASEGERGVEVLECVAVLGVELAGEFR
jgi:hypothetical protein